ncbi:hypothetical protein A9G36_03885 [Gilliamella sp. Choc6-1]|uniref:tRNA1(Val) (adenine(37)-N6)-methyltransferase n=1 Tax=Gilliamella sp. Choc6-1 TaxID=3120239 RepID=UPI00080ED436|nr:methyltransferase [Gilliamella apicola]OCG56187.1 hypothetical protein A9G36_03885 [Gilliamella apicola]
MTNNHQKPLKKGGFTFKRFFVAHDKSPMQVTTDSCLLGAWAPIPSELHRVLDIGSGCGVIALMLAQRLENQICQIDAIDIDKAAVKQCQKNIKRAGFQSIIVQQADINQFQVGITSFYDLIVTNPPYFASAVECRNASRQLARYTESLNFHQLIDTVKRLLKPQGVFCLVLPFNLSNQFRLQSESNQLYLQQVMNVKYNANKDFSLSLMAFSLSKKDNILIQQLCMRDDNGCYSQEFRKLLAKFYLFRK